jgi:hypothetical protein
VLLRVSVFIMHVLAAAGGLLGGFFAAFGMIFLIDWLGWRVVPIGPQSTDAPRALMLGLVCAGISIAAGIILCKNFGRPRAYLASFLIASGIAQIAINLAFLGGGVWRWGQETVFLSYFVIAIAIVILWQVRLRAW